MEKILENQKIVKRELSIERITDRLSYFEDKKIETMDGKVTHERVNTGISLTSVLMDVKTDGWIDTDIPVDWMYEGKSHVIAIEKKEYDDLMKGKIHICSIEHFWNNYKYDPENYVYVLYSGYSWDIADLDGKVIPVPMDFSYIDGLVNAGHYDLDRVLEFMKNDDRFIPRYYRGDFELEIMKIPYYDADKSNGGLAIEFMYVPSQEDAEKLKDMGTCEESMFIRDILKEFEIKR